MGRVKVSAYVAGTGAAAKSGISISLNEARNGQQHIRIGITEAAQIEFFGGALDPKADAIELLLYNDPGSVHVMGLRRAEVAHEDGLPLHGGIKGALSLKLVPWRKVASGKRPAVSMPVVNRQAGKMVSVKLPEWARLEPMKIGAGKSIMES